MNEATYQRKLITKLFNMFPGCVIQKQDPTNEQGIPDLLILFEDRWAMLEVKVSETAPERPNQSYYVDKYNGLSFAAFIHPQNEEQVLHDLQSAFRARRKTRVS